MPADEVLARLAREAPDGLEFLAIESIPQNLTAQVCRAVYRLPLPAERLAALPESCTRLLAQSECWIERHRPELRRVNIRPYILDLRIEGNVLEIDLRVTPTGSARADEVVVQLGCRDLLDAGVVLERTKLDLIDEKTEVEHPVSVT
jgi:hypothetical protein